MLCMKPSDKTPKKKRCCHSALDGVIGNHKGFTVILRTIIKGHFNENYTSNTEGRENYEQFLKSVKKD